MKNREKEAYLREYEVLKKKGKPFFPYAVMKDSVMMLIVVIVVIAMSLILGAELGPKADPTTTTYVPRPEWYFFFLFELLRVIKPPELVPIATDRASRPSAWSRCCCCPFYDRGPERRPERRPIATTAGILIIVAMAYLTYLGAVRARRRRSTWRSPSATSPERRWWPSPAALPATSWARTATTALVRS